MLSLREQQAGFAAALFNPAASRAAPGIRADGISPAMRLGFYRTNVFENYRKALAATYPAVEKLVGIYSARVMSQSMPWIAQEAGLFRKNNLDFHLVYIASSGMVTAAMLSGDAEISLTGGVGIVRAYAQGATDLVFIGSAKNVLTQSILAGAEIKRPEDLKGKKVAMTSGTTSDFFLDAILAVNGISRRETTVVNLKAEEIPKALEEDDIDAASMFNPYTMLAQKSLGERCIVLHDDDIYTYTFNVVATQDFVRKNPIKVRKVLRALVRAGRGDQGLRVEMLLLEALDVGDDPRVGGRRHTCQGPNGGGGGCLEQDVREQGGGMPGTP